MIIDNAKPLYLLTVPHSGTHSVRKTFEDDGLEYRWNHFEKVYEIAIPRILDENNIITTYRDPRLVAASWANRQHGGFTRPENIRRWYANWKRWGLVADHAMKVFTMDELGHHLNRYRLGDISGAKLAIIEKNWDRYYEIVPKKLIDYAEEICYACRS